MNSDNGIHGTAKLMIIQHGDQAHEQALHKANEMLMDNDKRGHVIWLRIIDAIDELQNKNKDMVQ
jgi:hypothetical protein